MNKPRKPSPARSQGAARTPTRLKPRRSLSVTSQRSNGSGILSDLHKKNMESFVLSPLVRKSILTDNTEIEEPIRKSWWKNLDENSRDLEHLDENQILEANNIIEELDIEILSQGKKNYTMDLPESSGSESINSIVIPQRKLFNQKENLPLKKFGEIIGTRETLAKLHKPNTDKTINTGTRELFQNKQRSKPIFPAALLNISPDKTAADKTKEFTAEPKSQVRTIFGNRSTKRKNIFTNFIESESEGEISDIQPKVFGFQKKLEAKRRGSSSSRGIREPSPTSSITTDIEMDDWKMLPSSTMVEHQLETLMTGQTPKRARLSKLTEIESEAGSNATKHSNKSASSNYMDKSRKSKTFTKEKVPDSEFMTNKNMSKISQNEQEISGQNQDKSRKSKTFTKEKAPVLETVSNTLHVAHEEIEEIVDKNKSSQDKSRKSKTFTKEKAPELENVCNTSHVSHEEIEEMGDKNKSSQDKFRKSKTFTKEKEPDSETSMSTTNNEIFVQSQVANKSKSKIAEINTSLSSIKTRSQNKNTSPDSSQLIEEPVLNFFANKSKSMYLPITPKDKHANIHSEAIPATADQNNDEELNFTLQYENENNEDQEIDEIHNKSTAETSKSNKVVEESEELESNEEKNNRSVKALNKSQGNDTSKENEKKNEMDIDNVELGLEEIEDKSKDHKIIDKEVDIENHVESEVENIDKSSQEVDAEKHCESGVENEVPQDEVEDQNESKVIQEHSIVQDQSEDQAIEDETEEGQNESQEKLDDSEIEQNKSQEEDEDDEEDQDQNESQEVEDENEDEDLGHNESQELEDENGEEDIEQNKCLEVEDENKEEDQDQNESQEVEDENEEQYQEQNTIQEEIEQGTDMEQNESGIQDTNESEDENQEESEDVADSDDEIDNEPDEIQEDANESDNQDIESDQDENQEVDEVIETPNVSHDTTGRHRKKNESPEAILHDSNNHLDSFAIQGRNTSVMKTEIMQTMNIQPILAPVRESTGFSDGNSNEGSGWDSHRTTRKTLRQTFGREFTPRKSLRALVMEKSAKRRTQQNEIASVTAPFPQANSTEMPDMSNRYDDGNEVHENQETNHEVSLRTRQKTLETYFQEVRKKNAETRLRIEEEVRNSLNAPPKHHIFKIPAKPLFARRTKPPPKPKQNNAKSTLIFGELPEEFIEDMKYKPPKRFQPGNAPWITKHLYKYLETKLEPKYDYKARIRAEKLVESIYNFARDLRRRDVATPDAVSVLKREMARLNVVKTHFDFYEFFHQFMPRDVREKVIPDVVNNISLPRNGVFADIL